MSALQQILMALGGTVTAAIKGGAGANGSTSFVVPAGVTSLSMLVVGAGGGGGAGTGGGGGGACVYSNNVAVTPGETLTRVVGAGGVGGVGVGANGTGGGLSGVYRGGTALVLAIGGQGSNSGAGGRGGETGTNVGSVGSVIFAGGSGSSSDGDRGGGGGQSGSPLAAGAGGVAASTIYRGGARGGAIGIDLAGWGLAANGSESSSINGVSAYNGIYYNGSFDAGGGGGGGAYGEAGHTTIGTGGDGSNGAVVLIWGGRTFSSGTSY